MFCDVCNKSYQQPSTRKGLCLSCDALRKQSCGEMSLLKMLFYRFTSHGLSLAKR